MDPLELMSLLSQPQSSKPGIFRTVARGAAPAPVWQQMGFESQEAMDAFMAARANSDRGDGGKGFSLGVDGQTPYVAPPPASRPPISLADFMSRANAGQTKTAR